MADQKGKSLRKVDEVRVTILVDGSFDVLTPSTEVAKRFPLTPDLFDRPWPVAEGGFSALVSASEGEERYSVLLDTGITPTGMMHNMDVLGISPQGIEAVVISHSHGDHVRGLPALIKRIKGSALKVVVHPDALLERKVILPNGTEVRLPPPETDEWRGENVEIVECTGPSMLANEMVLVSGQVARTTEFERGFSIHYAKREDVWEPDPLILDDQCVIANVRGKGLVVVTGCGHAGIINTVRYAQALTGEPTVHAVIGGFHLTGGVFEEIIPETVAALKQINPRYVFPAHCTGGSAQQQIANAMPDEFIQNQVGTTLVFQGSAV